MTLNEVTRVLRAHALAAVLLVAGLVVRLLSSAGLGLTAAVGLLCAAAAYVVLVRWGCWRWLAALAMVPALFDERMLVDQDTRPLLGLALFAAGLVVVSWHGWSSPLKRLAAGAVLVVAGAALGLADVTAVDPGVISLKLDPRGWPAGPLSGIGVLAALGVGRSRDPDPRAVTGACVIAGVLGDLGAVTWWPVAGALGVTLLLRGRRGPATRRPQADEVDSAALAAYDARYGDRPLPPVAIVIAAYNEAEGLPGVLTQLPTEVCGLAAEVVVVDDGSSDGTAAAIDASPARVVACERNRGQGAALRLGYRIAREHGARFVLTTDADGQYDVADFPAVLQPILDDRADFVSGSRILGAQHTHDKVRRVGVHVFAWLATILTGRRLTDTSFGLRAMRAELTGVVTLNQPQYQSSELLLGVLSHGYRVLEVPGTMHVRAAGSTKKGRNLVYGSRYARVMTGTWWREGCPRPAADTAPALRHTRGHGAD